MEATILDANQQLACALFSQQAGLNAKVSSILEANAKSISITMNYPCNVEIPDGAKELEQALLKRLEEVGAKEVKKTSTDQSTSLYSFQINGGPPISVHDLKPQKHLQVKREITDATTEAHEASRGSSSSLPSALGTILARSTVGPSEALPRASKGTHASVACQLSPTRKKFRGSRNESPSSSEDDEDPVRQIVRPWEGEGNRDSSEEEIPNSSAVSLSFTTAQRFAAGVGRPGHFPNRPTTSSMPLQRQHVPRLTNYSGENKGEFVASSRCSATSATPGAAANAGTAMGLATPHGTLEAQLLQHALAQPVQPDRPNIRCEYCNEMCMTKRYLHQHKKDEHRDRLTRRRP